MGVGLFPVFDPELPGLCLDSDGKTLARALPELDALAREIGIKPLSDFGLNPGIPGEFEGDFTSFLDQVEELEFEEEWYEISDGLTTLSSLLSIFQKIEEETGDVSSEIPDLDLVRAELVALEECLTRARSKNALFRLDIL